MKYIVTCVIGAVLTVTAQAEGFMPWTTAVEQADLNNDGMVTMAEIEQFKPVDDFPGFQPFMADHFGDLDTNGDGMVDTDELAGAKEMFQMSDTELSQAFFARQGFMPRAQ